MESLTAKLLARASGKDKVEVGETVVANVNKVVIHDVTGSITLDVIEEIKRPIENPDKLYVFLDHYSPPPSPQAANIHSRFRAFKKNYPQLKFFDVGEGVCHQVMVEGNVGPGEVVVGADSHTTTYGALAAFSTGVGSTEAAYAIMTGRLWFKVPEPMFIEVEGSLKKILSGKDVILEILRMIGQDGANYKAMEFFGPGLKSLKMSDRLTIANMSVEGGAKNAIFPADEVLISYMEKFTYSLGPRELAELKSHDGEMNPDLTIDLSALEPMVAKPHSPANGVPVGDVEGIDIHAAFIGSCTNGRYEDFLIAAEILKGKRISRDVRLIITPASKKVLTEMLESGIAKILLDAGAVITPPSCGACFGGHLGVVGDSEVIISSSNRNFVGRMGSPKAKIYLASPATVAASALEGHIADPRRHLR
ncbi:MAG: 3-isopropylmalate dehydratase large subunit [Fervidicoccaceae archaeon]